MLPMTKWCREFFCHSIFTSWTQHWSRVTIPCAKNVYHPGGINFAIKGKCKFKVTGFASKGVKQGVHWKPTYYLWQNKLIDLKDKPSCTRKPSHLNVVHEVGEYVLLNGPLVTTQDAAKCKGPSKKQGCRWIVWNSLQLPLSDAGVYLWQGISYQVQEPMKKIWNQTIANPVNEDKLVNERVSDRLHSVFKTALEYADTPRDKQLIKGLIAELTSITFTAKLQGIESQQGTNLPRVHWSVTWSTTQISKEHPKLSEVIWQWSSSISWYIAEGWGGSWSLQVAAVLKYAFSQLDVIGGRGGLEAHPPLTMGTHYRATDNATTMRKAQKTVLSLAPQGFSISLSEPAITIYWKAHAQLRHSDIILVRA